MPPVGRAEYSDQRTVACLALLPCPCRNHIELSAAGVLPSYSWPRSRPCCSAVGPHMPTTRVPTPCSTRCFSSAGTAPPTSRSCSTAPRPTPRPWCRCATCASRCSRGSGCSRAMSTTAAAVGKSVIWACGECSRRLMRPRPARSARPIRSPSSPTRASTTPRLHGPRTPRHSIPPRRISSCATPTRATTAAQAAPGSGAKATCRAASIGSPASAGRASTNRPRSPTRRPPRHRRRRTACNRVRICSACRSAPAVGWNGNAGPSRAGRRRPSPARSGRSRRRPSSMPSMAG